MHIFLALLSSILVLTHCSHLDKQQSLKASDLAELGLQISDKDPESIVNYFDKMAKQDNVDKNTLLWMEYKKAQVWQAYDRNKSCKHYSELAKNNNFALQDLAELNAQRFCDKFNPQIIFNLDYYKNKKHLRPLQFEIAKAKADEKQGQESLMLIAVEQSKWETIPSVKVAHMQRAIQIASKLKKKQELEEYNKRLYNLAPRLMPVKMEKDFLKIANDYRYNREFSEAIFYYNEILKSKKIKYEEKIQSYKALAQTYKLQKDYKKNIQYLDELVTYIQSLKLKASVKSKLEIENSILLARAKWTEHHADQAKALLKKVLAKKDIAKYKHKANAEAYWIIARIYEEEKKYSTSLEYLAKAVAIGDSPILETALWNQAWIERKEQKLEASNQSLILLQNTTKNLYLKNKFIYWQAQNLKDLGKTQEANDIWQKLSQEDTHGYYGILSHRALNKKFSRIQSNNDYDKTLTELKINKHKKSYFEWLVAVGEFSVAQNYLKELNLNTKSQQELLSFLESQAKAQNFAVLFEQILKLDEVNRREILKIKPEFLFPRPYYSSVSEAANKYGVHSSLIYSIIRQESSFNPSARSHADAFGLMQLLPTEARRLASQNDLSIEQDEDLFIPERNIFLGTAYLRELFDRFHGQFILSVASYNAAEDAVKSWLKTRYKGDPISFIEDIPYQETQGYVKIILRNLVFYQRLAAPDQEHDFPEWTLQNLDDFASL